MTPFDFTFRKKGCSEARTFSADSHFRFDIDRIEDFFACHLPSPMIDLLRIAMAVYVSDRLIRRRQRDQQRNWARQIELKVGVLEPTFWNTEEIHNSLLDCIEFLTDDTWSISFTQDDRRRSRDIQKLMFPPSPDALLCLYSSGLDSAAGLGSQLIRDSNRPAIPVTVWHQGGQKFNTEKQIRVLRSRFNSEITPLIFKAHLRWGSQGKRYEESTQRSRAFLFLVAGAAAAYLNRTSQIEVYESGIGAVNLPLLCGMTGSRTTRSTHPEFLRRVSDFVSNIACREIRFTLPFWNLTKGQLVRQLVGAELQGLARSTVSCVSYPLRHRISKQCGVCPACIFRRQAMLSAGIEEIDGTYMYDLFSGRDIPKQPSVRQLSHLKAFLMQVAELEPVRSGRRLPDRILRHLMGTGILKRGESSAHFIRLFSEYRREWLAVANNAERHGYEWTKYISVAVDNTGGATNASV